MSNQIIIKNDGPVRDLVLSLPKGGGLVRLLGTVGVGKSHVLAGIDALITGKGRIPVTDGEAKAEISAFGATLRVSQRLSRAGELEVTSLRGKFDIADLIEPGYDDPAASDRVRIKALIQLTGKAKADPALFYPLVGQELFDQTVDPDSLKTTDLVQLALNIKSDFEKAARDEMDKSKHDSAKSESSRQSVGDTDLEAEHDSKKLSDAHLTAVKFQAGLDAKSQAAKDAEKRRDESLNALKRLEDSYKGLSFKEAEEEHSNALGAVKICNMVVTQLEAALQQAKENQTRSILAETNTLAAKNAAAAYDNSRIDLQAIIDSEIPESVSLLDLEQAEMDVQTALAAMEQGTLVRQALQALQTADELKKSAAEHEVKSTQFRDAALSTEFVLSSAVQQLGCPLYVSGGRLMIDSERGAELFQDLSKGEKTLIVVDIAINTVGSGGIFILPQENYEGLPPSIQRQVAGKLENTGAWCVTAQATDDPGISSEVVDPVPLG